MMTARFTMLSNPSLPSMVEPSGSAAVEIPRRSGNWISLEDVMHIHTNANKNPLDALEIGQAEVSVSNISKNFNSAESASAWYKRLEGFAIQLFAGYSEDETPVSRKLFTGIISAIDVDRLELTAGIKVVDFLDYFGRITIEQTPVWQNISLTQLYKNLVELAFPEWVEGVDYFVEDLGDITIPVIGYEKINLLKELRNIANSRGKRLFTDADGKLVCRSRGTEGDAWPISYDSNLISVVEKRDINSISNWIIVHATPYEIPPDLTPPGKVADFTATPDDQKIDLSWSNPTDDDFEKVLIRWSKIDYPANVSDGTKLYEGIGESKSHTGLTNGTKYFYSAFTVDDVENWSEAAHTSAIAGAGEEPVVDESPASSVSAFTAIAEHSRIILTWHNPNITNFSLVRVRFSTTSFPNSPTAGSSVYEGTAETTLHSDLVNGQRYYYSIFTKNTSEVWSGAEFASAIPGDARSDLQSSTFTGAATSGYIPGVLGLPYGFSSVPYGDRWNMTFQSFEGKFSEDWFRFTHEWDLILTWTTITQDIPRRYKGKEEDLPLNFTKIIEGMQFWEPLGSGVKVSVQTYKVEASKVQFWYRISYNGRASHISFRNKLTLRG